MTVPVTAGGFSRMTYLSVKTLRYYPDTGLLVPRHGGPGHGLPPLRPGARGDCPGNPPVP
jgi:hypothetical protein